MIRIDWSEVEAAKNRLLQSGATEALEMIVIIFYHDKMESDKIQIRLGQLEHVLFNLSSNKKVKGIFLYDSTMTKPYLKCEEAAKASGMSEEVPNSGHCSVVADFGKMSPEARDVWLEIAFSQQQHYVSEKV